MSKIISIQNEMPMGVQHCSDYKHDNMSDFMPYICVYVNIFHSQVTDSEDGK